MDTQNPSVPPHARSRRGGTSRPRRLTQHHPSGIVHDNTRHTSRFTVIGNHLAQHPELSGLAIGLGVYIQSLATGARVDIKTLAARFPEGAQRISAALRELETHGYLRRTRERLPSGRIVTRTISCNQPGARRREEGDAPACPAAEGPTVSPEPTTAPVPTPVPAPTAEPGKKAGRKPLPDVPQPVHPSPVLLQKAVDLLADLRGYDSRLLLSECDVAHLAPGVAAWLERDVRPGVLRRALIDGLPADGPRRPAALLAHRLSAQLPPWPPYGTAAADAADSQPPGIRHPLVNCDGCDRAYRGSEPGLCGDCRRKRAVGSGNAGGGNQPACSGGAVPA